MYARKASWNDITTNHATAVIKRFGKLLEDEDANKEFADLSLSREGGFSRMNIKFYVRYTLLQ